MTHQVELSEYSNIRSKEKKTFINLLKNIDIFFIIVYN